MPSTMYNQDDVAQSLPHVQRGARDDVAAFRSTGHLRTDFLPVSSSIGTVLRGVASIM